MRLSPTALFIGTLTTISACAGGGGPSSSSPPILGYSVDGDVNQSYAQADTTSLNLDMGGQMIDVNIRLGALLDMALAPVPEGVQVTASWRDLDVIMTNPMGPAERTSEDDVEGPLVFTLDRRGAAEVISVPALKGTAPQMVVPHGVAEGFFPRLPGTPPSAGMSWTDTVAYEADIEGAKTANETVFTYTVVGDTLVDGRSLLKVATEGEGTSSQEGVTQGMDFQQALTGTVNGFFLWDLAAGVLRYQWTETDYSGTMNVTAAPFPLGVSMRGVSHVRLVEDDDQR